MSMLNEIANTIIKSRHAFSLSEQDCRNLSFLKVGGNPWAEGRINYLVFTEGSTEPVLFVKMIRERAKGVALQREYELLQQLASHNAVAPFLPLPAALLSPGDHPILVQGVCRGRRLISSLSKSPFLFHQQSRIARNFHQASRFLKVLNGNIQQTLRIEDFHRLFTEPLLSFERALMGKNDPVMEAYLGEVGKQAVTCLFLTPLHGDYSATNIFLEPQGDLKIIDWETGSSNGLPLCDLFYFMTKYIHNLKILPKNRWRRVETAYFGKTRISGLIEETVLDYCTSMKIPVHAARLILPFHFLLKAKTKFSMRSREMTAPWYSLFRSALKHERDLCF